MSPTMRDEVHRQAAEAFEAMADTVLAGLAKETIAELDRRVSSDGEGARAVAESYLADQGLL